MGSNSDLETGRWRKKGKEEKEKRMDALLLIVISLKCIINKEFKKWVDGQTETV